MKPNKSLERIPPESKPGKPNSISQPQVGPALSKHAMFLLKLQFIPIVLKTTSQSNTAFFCTLDSKFGQSEHFFLSFVYLSEA